MSDITSFWLAKYVQGFKRFREGYHREHQATLAALMEQPQSAKTLMIACSDSRIDPALKFDVGPGEIFMVRNIASLVPPYTADGQHHGTSAAIAYAVLSLKVEDIIVLGHAHCGGIRHLMSHDETQEFVSPWMEIARDARRKARHAKANAQEACRICEKEAVKISLHNLMTFPWISDAINLGALRLHGWYVDMAGGTLEMLDDTGAFASAVPMPGTLHSAGST